MLTQTQTYVEIANLIIRQEVYHFAQFWKAHHSHSFLCDVHMGLYVTMAIGEISKIEIIFSYFVLKDFLVL